MFKLEMRFEGYFQSWRLVLVEDDWGGGAGQLWRAASKELLICTPCTWTLMSSNMTSPSALVSPRK